MEVETSCSEDNREVPIPSNGIDSDSIVPCVSLAQAERFCRRLATTHYENFLVASIFLPRRMRQPFYTVYAFCRHADDLADHSPTPEIATKKLLAWRRQLADCFSGEATHPIFIALRAITGRFNLRIDPFDKLLTAFLQDQSKVSYQDFDELLDYCQYSANPVGRIVLRLADADSDHNVRLSDSICTGLQLVNHWQDVARDFHAGRVYLPKDDAKRFAVDLEVLDCSDQRQRFCRLIQFQCERSSVFLQDGLSLPNQVPRWLANDIRLFVHGGLATLEAIARVDYDVLKVRPKVSRFKQMRLLAAATFGRLA